MPRININGIELFYEIHGKGMPIVLIAGLASDSQSWLSIINELATDFCVITFDNRGSGRTKPLDCNISIQNITDDCIALIKHLGLSSVNILGHSMGGFVALDCAIRYPAHVSKLFLAGTSAFNSERNNTLFLDWVSYMEDGMKDELWFKNIFYWIFSKRFFEDKNILNNAIKGAIEYPYQQTPAAFRNQVNAIIKFNCVENLGSIQARTMIICGEEDILFFPDESFEALKNIPNTVFKIVKNAAHPIHIENSEEFIKIIQSF